MDNREDKARHRQNSAARGHRDSSDPIVQAGDYSGKGPKDNSKTSRASRVAPTPVLPGSQTLVPVRSAAMGTNTFMGDSEPIPAAPSVSDHARSMLCFKWTIVVIFVLLAAPAIAAIWTQVTPKYQARAGIRISPIIPHVVFKTEDTGMMPLYDSFVNTQVLIVKGPIVLKRALETEAVLNTQWYKNPRRSLKERVLGYQVSPFERLTDSLVVRRRHKTEITDVVMEDPNAVDARVIVQAVVDEYKKYAGTTSDAVKDDIYLKVVNEYNRLKRSVETLQQTCFDFQEQLGTGDPDRLLSTRAIALDETRTALATVQQDISTLDLQIEKALGADAKASGADANDTAVASTEETSSQPKYYADANDTTVASTEETSSQPKYYTDGEWSRLDSAVKSARYAIRTSPLKPSHPGYNLLEEGVEFAAELLRDRQEQLDEQWRLTRGLAALASDANSLSPEERPEFWETQLEILKDQERNLIVDLGKKEEEYNRLFTIAQNLKKETETLHHQRGLFATVQTRKDAKDMERNSLGRIKVEPATASFTPHNDRRVLLTTMAMVVSMGVAGGVAFLRASVNQTIRRSQDMPRGMDVPFLGNVFVPEISAGRSIGKSLYDKVQQRRLRLIESVRIVRTSLLSRLEGQDSTSAVVTSAGAATGKTTLTVMLGKSLAQAGKKVLLIDADFYKATLTKRFALSEESGLRETLRAHNKCKCPIFQTETHGLSIMPAGKRTDNEVVFDQTANGAFRACIDRLQKQYDIILVDSPPVLPVADAAILSNKVDGVIMVERELISRREEVIRAIARLSSAGGRFLGTVFMGPADRKEHYGVDYDYAKANNA